MKKYSELLRDPRWQKKRLKIMERDDFACRKCESKTKTLHVHHNYYLSGAAPWEYPNSALFTLCDECHEDEEAAKKHMDEMLVLLLRQGGALNSDIKHLATLINDICDQGDDQSGVPMILHVLGELWTERRGKK